MKSAAACSGLTQEIHSMRGSVPLDSGEKLGARKTPVHRTIAQQMQFLQHVFSGILPSTL